MQVEENEYLVVYSGHNLASLLYQKLIKRSCKVELVSTPAKIYNGCSKAIKFKGIYMDIVRDEIGKINLKPRGIYKITQKGQSQNYEKI